MKKVKILLIIICFLLGFRIISCFAQTERWPIDWDAGTVYEKNIPKNWEGYSYSNPQYSNQEMKYRVILPENYNSLIKYPLLIFLNDKQYRGDDNIAQLGGVFIGNSLLKEKYKDKYPCIILAPQLPEGCGWVNGKISPYEYRLEKTPISDSCSMLMDILEIVENKWSVDSERILLGGLDDGASGVWDLLARFPDKFAAAFPMGGITDPTVAETIKDIPIFAIHNYNDIQIPVFSTRNMVEALEKCDGNVFYYEFKNVKGGTFKIIYETPYFYDWLFTQRRINSIHNDMQTEGDDSYEISLLKQMGILYLDDFDLYRAVTNKEVIQSVFEIMKLKNSNLQNINNIWEKAKKLSLQAPSDLKGMNDSFKAQYIGRVVCNAMNYERMVDNNSNFEPTPPGISSFNYQYLKLAQDNGVLSEEFVKNKIVDSLTVKELVDILYKMVRFDARFNYAGFDAAKTYQLDDVLLEDITFVLKRGRIINNDAYQRLPVYNVTREEVYDNINEVRWCEFIADVVRKSENAEICLVDLDTTKQDFTKTELTVQDVYDCISNDSSVAIVEWSGKELYDYLVNFNIDTIPCFSGIRIIGKLEPNNKYDITDIFVGAQKIKLNQIYKVAYVQNNNQNSSHKIPQLVIQYLDKYSINLTSLVQERLILN